MALQLSQTIKTIPCDYWRISNLHNDYNTTKTAVMLGLYPSQTARQEDLGNAMLSRSYEFEGVDMSRADCYGLIKVLPEFERAVDC